MKKISTHSNYLQSQPQLQGAVIRLLFSRDDANLRLAIQLLSRAETPPLLRAALLVAAHQERRSQAQQLMLKHALRIQLPEALVPVYDKLFHLHHPTDPYPGPNGLHINSLSRLLDSDDALDGMEVARMMVKSDDVRLQACGLHHWLLSQDERLLYYVLSTLKAGDLKPALQHKTFRLYARLNEAMYAFRRMEILKLDGQERQLSRFPEVVADLPVLKEMHLLHHEFETIPPKALALPRLEKLSLTHNRLSEFPPFAQPMPQLHYLDLSYQKNPWQDYASPLDSLPGLKSLKLAGLGLREIPEAIASLPALVHLDLRDNEIRELPDFLFELPRLQSVDLRGNKVHQFPDGELNLKLRV